MTAQLLLMIKQPNAWNLKCPRPRMHTKACSMYQVALVNTNGCNQDEILLAVAAQFSKAFPVFLHTKLDVHLFYTRIAL